MKSNTITKASSCDGRVILYTWSKKERFSQRITFCVKLLLFILICGSLYYLNFRPTFEKIKESIFILFVYLFFLNILIRDFTFLLNRKILEYDKIRGVVITRWSTVNKNTILTLKLSEKYHNRFFKTNSLYLVLPKKKKLIINGLFDQEAKWLIEDLSKSLDISIH